MFQIIGRRAPNNIQAALRSRIQRSKRGYHAATAVTNSFASVGYQPEQSSDAKSYTDSSTNRFVVANADSLSVGSSNMTAISKRIADMQLSGDGDEDDDGG